MSQLLPLLAYLLLAVDPWGQRVIEDDVRSILSDESYGFCHDEEYPLTEAEADWCPFRAEAIGRCDGWARACSAPRAELRGAPGRLSTRRKPDPDQKVEKQDTPARTGGEGPRRRAQRPERDTVEVPSMGGFAEILFWAIVVITVLALVRAVMSNFADERGGDDEGKPAGPEAEQLPDDNEVARRAMETDVDRLLAYAKDAAGKGEFEAAVDYSHAALLRRLDHEGLIHLHRSRTNGDYVRDLRKHPDWRAPVRDALRHVDRAQFGNTPPTGDTFETIFTKVRDIVKRAAPMAVWLMIAVGLGCDSDPAKSYPWEHSPSGQQAVVDVLRARGYGVEFHTGSLTTVEDSGATIIMLEGASATVEEWEFLDEYVGNGGSLFVASGEAPPWMDLRVTYGPPSSDPVPLDVNPDDFGTYNQPLVFVPDGPLLEGVDDRVFPFLDRAGEPYAVTAEHGQGWIVVLADDDVFTNASVTMGDNAPFLVELVAAGGSSEVRFVDAWASAGAENPFDSVRKSNLTPAVIQLLLFVLVLFAWRGVRFGRGRDPAGASRLAFTQHAKAMSQHYRKARAVEYAARVYASWALERLRDRFPAAARGGLAGLSATVARRTGRDETHVMRLLVEAHSAAESHGDGRDDAPDASIIDAPAGVPSGPKQLIRELGKMMRELGGKQ